MVKGGAHASSRTRAEKGYTYILEFSIARGDERDLVAGRDYKMN